MNPLDKKTIIDNTIGTDFNKLMVNATPTIPSPNVPINNTPTYSTINADSVLNPTKLMTVPPPVTTNTANNSLAYYGDKTTNSASTNIANTTIANTEKANTATTNKIIADKLSSLIGQQGTKEDFINTTTRDVGLSDKETALNSLNNEAITTKAAIEKRIKDIYGGGGITIEQANTEAEAIRRQGNQDLANIALLQSVAQNNVLLARNTIDSKVKAKFESIDNQIKSYEQLYNLNLNDLTDSERITVQGNIDNKKAMTKANMDAYTTVIENISNSNAPLGTKQALLASIDRIDVNDKNTTPSSFYKVAGAYGGDAYKQAQVNSLNETATNKKATNNAIANVKEVNPNSSTYIKDKIEASAGGLKLTGDLIKPLVKSFSIVDQIDSLQKNLKNVDTGPIVGILKSANPYDVKAQLVKAQIKALIPGLAKGVYGEVGVLTDADIENYSKTIGNLKSTKDLNNLLLAMTLNTIKSGIDSQLGGYADSGRDVSGYTTSYSQLDSKINSLNKELGVTSTSFDSEEQALIDAGYSPEKIKLIKNAK